MGTFSIVVVLASFIGGGGVSVLNNDATSPTETTAPVEKMWVPQERVEDSDPPVGMLERTERITQMTSQTTIIEVEERVETRPSSSREWFFAKSAYENHYLQWTKDARQLYFDGAYFEGTLDQEYWLGIGFYRTREYTMDSHNSKLSVPEALQTFIADVPEVKLTERVRRRDFLATAQMVYTIESWSRPLPFLSACKVQNCEAEFAFRLGVGLATFAYNDIREYSLDYGDGEKKIHNPVDRTFTKSYLYGVGSTFVRLGIVRFSFDTQVDPTLKQDRWFINDVRFVTSAGIQF